MLRAPPSLPDDGLLVDSMPCGLLVTASDGTILRANLTFCRWLGLVREDVVSNAKLQDFLTMGARMFFHTHWGPLLEMQGSIAEIKFEVRAADGRTLPMLFNVIRRMSDGGVYDQVSAVIALERNKYETELLAARKRADEMASLEHDKLQFAEQMIGIVSHDLRNPLAVILSAGTVLSRLEAHADHAKQQRLLSSIVQAVKRAQRLVDDLLDFTSARVGPGLPVRIRTLDLHRVVLRAVDELSVAFPGRVVACCQDDSGAAADADRLAQLIGNLVSNALTYGDPNGVVTVSAGVRGGFASLSVHNTGLPISLDLIDRLFEPMVQGVTEGGSRRSVGLGLYIVQAIAKAHGGTVVVSSTVQTGTTFTVKFPADGASAPAV